MKSVPTENSIRPNILSYPTLSSREKSSSNLVSTGNQEWTISGDTRLACPGPNNSAVFGLLLGTIFCGALLATWIKFFDTATAIEESNLAPVLVDFLPIVLVLLPDEFDAVRSFFQK